MRKITVWVNLLFNKQFKEEMNYCEKSINLIWHKYRKIDKWGKDKLLKYMQISFLSDIYAFELNKLKSFWEKNKKYIKTEKRWKKKYK